MRRFASVLVFGMAAVAACTGDAPKNTSCTGALYDPCGTEHDCQSGMCLPFGNLVVCTQGCTAGDNSTCPKQDGMTVTCTPAGTCQPPAQNMCTR
jgi:hypothetical protein